MQDALGLDEAPLRIECYDVSHLQENDVVASMVVFEDGLARKSEYRRFVIKGHAGQSRSGGDVASIHEVISRRFRRYVEERAETGEVEGATNLDGGTAGPEVPAGIDPETGRPRRFAYPPNLVVVDGGAPQVAAAQRALDELGVDDVALCGLAKRLEEVWLPGDPHPVVLPRTSEGLYLLQRVRDEAHRFAIALHRSRRSRSMTASALDGIAGPRRDPPEGAAQAVRLAEAAVRRHGRGDRARCRASAGVPPRRWSPPSPTGVPASGRQHRDR